MAMYTGLDKMHLQKIVPNSVIKLFDIFQSNKANARIVGGFVRDHLLLIDQNSQQTDIDICIDLEPLQVIAILEENNIKVIPTGVKFGTVTAVIDGQQIEITSLRRDIKTDGRHAEVIYSKDFVQDAERRDFTINAMSYDPLSDQLYDYFGGEMDLAAGRVCFIGDAAARISEDYLRILRFFRFSSRYAKEFDPEGMAASIDSIAKLAKLSKERIKDEMDKLLVTERFAWVLDIVQQNGMWWHVFKTDPFEVQKLEQAAKYIKEYNLIDILPLLYAVLFAGSDNVDVKYLGQLKFSTKQAKRIVSMHNIAFHADFVGIKQQIAKAWLDGADHLELAIFAMCFTDFGSEAQSYRKFLTRYKDKPEFPLKTAQLQELGYSGKELGEMIGLVYSAWIASDFAKTGDELLAELLAELN